jgi:hypothetical protein
MRVTDPPEAIDRAIVAPMAPQLLHMFYPAATIARVPISRCASGSSPRTARSMSATEPLMLETPASVVSPEHNFTPLHRMRVLGGYTYFFRGSKDPHCYLDFSYPKKQAGICIPY